jgi:hypothetical protein
MLMPAGTGLGYGRRYNRYVVDVTDTGETLRDSDGMELASLEEASGSRLRDFTQRSESNAAGDYRVGHRKTKQIFRPRRKHREFSGLAQKCAAERSQIGHFGLLSL